MRSFYLFDISHQVRNARKARPSRSPSWRLTGEASWASRGFASRCLIPIQACALGSELKDTVDDYEEADRQTENPKIGVQVVSLSKETLNRGEGTNHDYYHAECDCSSRRQCPEGCGGTPDKSNVAREFFHIIPFRPMNLRLSFSFLRTLVAVMQVHITQKTGRLTIDRLSSGTRDTVDGVMSLTVWTIEPEAPVESALKLMAKHDVGCLVVARGGEVVGIITERDIVRKMIGKGWKGLKQPVIEIASRPVISISPDTKVWEAFTTMLRKKIRRLPVEDHGKLVGLVTERDLFKWVVGVFYEPNIPEEFRKLVAQNP